MAGEVLPALAGLAPEALGVVRAAAERVKAEVELLIAAIEDNDPVLFFEPKRLYNGPFNGYWDRPAQNWSQHPAGDVPTGYYRIDLGKARIARAGEARQSLLSASPR